MQEQLHLELNQNQNQYMWQLYVTTNLGNRKHIKIVITEDSIENARINIISKILKVSRHGIACYNFELEKKIYYLVPMKAINTFKEYYEITNNFIDKINSTLPDIKYPRNPNCDKNLEFNVYAKPFVPSSLNS
jgi:hypothetical protein